MQRLNDLAGIGMRLADRIDQQAEQSNWLGADGVVMFERLARAVRQTIALEMKIEADSQMSEPQRADADARRAASAGPAGLKDQVGRLVEDAIAADTDPQERERLLRDLHERLGDPDIADELGNRSLGESVAAICQDLGITCDLSDFSDRAAPSPSRRLRDGSRPLPPCGRGAGSQHRPRDSRLLCRSLTQCGNAAVRAGGHDPTPDG